MPEADIVIELDRDAVEYLGLSPAAGGGLFKLSETAGGGNLKLSLTPQDFRKEVVIHIDLS